MVKFLPQSASLNGSDILSTRFKSVKKTFYKILYQHLKRDGNIAVTIWKRRNYAGFSPLTYLALILIGAFKVIFLLHFMESFQASFYASSQSCGGMLWNRQCRKGWVGGAFQLLEYQMLWWMCRFDTRSKLVSAHRAGVPPKNNRFPRNYKSWSNLLNFHKGGPLRAS